MNMRGISDLLVSDKANQLETYWVLETIITILITFSRGIGSIWQTIAEVGKLY